MVSPTMDVQLLLHFIEAADQVSFVSSISVMDGLGTNNDVAHRPGGKME
jgi:hypothetical protein